MGTYLAIYLGAAEIGSDEEINAERQSEFMAAWASWAQAHVDALIDPGAPVFRKKVVTSRGAREFTDAKVGYALVEAPSHDEAVRIFSEHPHLTLHDRNSIEVLECPAIEAG